MGLKPIQNDFQQAKKHCLKMAFLKCSRKDAKMKKFKDACKRLTDFKGHSNNRIPGNLVK